MPSSQLKQLKASLREKGLVGPQQSKKQKRQNSKNNDGSARLRRHAAISQVREKYNPFEVKGPSRPQKFDILDPRAVNKKTAIGRPGVTRGLGEERRRTTLLKEIQSRNRTGGILDRRFGENDPNMTPEERAAERFAKQAERKSRKSNIFNLEDEDEGADAMVLTHGGRALNSEAMNGGDAFDESVNVSQDEDDIDDRPTKRPRLAEQEFDGPSELGGEEGVLERRKTKQEVMKEVIAKSKLYKYERQQAKEDDDDLRAELDKNLPDFLQALQDHQPAKKSPTVAEPNMNADRAALLAGKDRAAADKEYNERVRQMAMDQRSKPAERTQTEDEKAKQEAERLQELERQRVRRMEGEPESDDEPQLPNGDADDVEVDDAELFGLGANSSTPSKRELDVEDEDDFVLDDELVASDVDADLTGSEEDSDETSAAESELKDDGDDDFINGLVLPKAVPLPAGTPVADRKTNGNLAYTYPCPQSHQEFLRITDGVSAGDLPTVIQRIRALYHPQLLEGNKAKLETFAAVLVQHIAYLGEKTGIPFLVIEALIRHVHSLAKRFSTAVGIAFRSLLNKISEERPLKLNHGDLVLLTAISVIFPTSDHFHSVVTPALLSIARYLGQSAVHNVSDLQCGAYCCTLALQYQAVAKRFLPEFMTYTLNALACLAPTSTNVNKGILPDRKIPEDLRIQSKIPASSEAMEFGRISDVSLEEVKTSLLFTFSKLLRTAAGLWQSKNAFIEIFAPAVAILQHLTSFACSSKLHKTTNISLTLTLSHIQTLITTSISARSPLKLHHHRPLAIKQSYPKFEESYNHDRHYDPDRERSEMNKLKAEHKKERKGAMRELRKDANFIAREQLREKKEKDAAYEKKFKRLVAEIQGEEGAEAKEYEREKRLRKAKR